jgi:SAM-dependent methyltransferase
VKEKMPVKAMRAVARRLRLSYSRITDFSQLRRVTPYRSSFGVNCGRCIDRYYIEPFLAAHANDIRGHVLEVESADYTTLYGGARVTRCDVIDLDENNEARTITADLTRCDAIAANTFDCIVLPQTLFLIYDFAAAVRTLHRILKPGGVVLATLPGIAQLCDRNMIGGAGQDYWRFTRHSARRLFSEVFGEANTTVASHGNVLAATAFLHGLVVEELSAEELDFNDPQYEVTITVRAIKEGSACPA